MNGDAVIPNSGSARIKTDQVEEASSTCNFLAASVPLFSMSSSVPANLLGSGSHMQLGTHPQQSMLNFALISKTRLLGVAS